MRCRSETVAIVFTINEAIKYYQFIILKSTVFKSEIFYVNRRSCEINVVERIDTTNDKIKAVNVESLLFHCGI